MRAALVPRSRSLRFAITPMIDIVFLLIIFFLVATHFVKTETQDPVELPLATQGNLEEEATPRRLVITVSADGVYSVTGRAVTWPELERMILDADQEPDDKRDREIRIRSDQAARYDLVKPILTTCARARISQVSFSVMPVDR